MKVNFLGFKDGKPWTTKEGIEKDGVRLFFSHPDNGVVGLLAASPWVDRTVFNSFGVSLSDLTDLCGSVIDVEFNQYGKVCGLSI
jgi:hypothetical protein